MVLLILLSVASVAVVIERALFYRRRRERLTGWTGSSPRSLAPRTARRRSSGSCQEDEPVLRAAASGLGNPGRNRGAVEKLVSSALDASGWRSKAAELPRHAGQQRSLHRALRHCPRHHPRLPGPGQSGRPNTSVVMAGISEALVATAIGCSSALPAVMFYTTSSATWIAPCRHRCPGPVDNGRCPSAPATEEGAGRRSDGRRGLLGGGTRRRDGSSPISRHASRRHHARAVDHLHGDHNDHAVRCPRGQAAEAATGESKPPSLLSVVVDERGRPISTALSSPTRHPQFIRTERRANAALEAIIARTSVCLTARWCG